MFKELFKSFFTSFDLDAETFEIQFKNDLNAVVIDVRTKAEFDEARIPGSILIDFLSRDFFNTIDRLDREKKYYLYCRSGSRSLMACRQMKQAGFNHVYNLSGGINKWRGEIEN